MRINSINLNLVSILFIFVCFLVTNCLSAEPIASNSNSISLPQELLYPEYFKIHDMILWENIKKELIFKFRFLTGRHPQKDYLFCHKFQKRISRAIDRAASENQLFFNVVDNKLLFDKDSGFDKILSPQSSRQNNKCNYHSFGDISKGCVIYCDYHGIDFESDFYKNHKKELEASKPLIIPEDIADFIIFTPSLLILIIIYFLLKKETRQNKIETAKTNH